MKRPSLKELRGMSDADLIAGLRAAAIEEYGTTEPVEDAIKDFKRVNRQLIASVALLVIAAGLLVAVVIYAIITLSRATA